MRSSTFTTLALTTLVALAAGCASRPDVRLDQDPNVDLAGYKTFAFFEPTAIDGARYTTLMSSRLKQAARQQLEKQGYVYAETNPELRVNLFLKVVDKQELRSAPGGRDFYGYRNWSGQVDLADYRQGTLAVDLVDARSNRLVWQGVAEGRVDDKAMKEPGPAIEKAFSEMFIAYPTGVVKQQAATAAR